jgi:chromosome segregation ATPase
VALIGGKLQKTAVRAVLLDAGDASVKGTSEKRSRELRLCEERDYLQSHTTEKEETSASADSKLEETVVRAPLLNMEPASLKETFNERWKELEESLSTHRSDLKSARGRIDALDKLVSELKHEKASLEEERDVFQSQACEMQEIVPRAALLDTELASGREACEKRSKELEKSLSVHQADLHAARERLLMRF